MLIRCRKKTVRDIEINTVRNKQRNRYRHKSEVKERISTFEMRSDTTMLANHVSTIKSIRVLCDSCTERKRFVCLSVLYAFYHRTTDFDETFQEPPSHSGQVVDYVSSAKMRSWVQRDLTMQLINQVSELVGKEE